MSRTLANPMRNYYAVVNVEERRLGTYVSAENVAAAFESATFKYQARHPRSQVETIAVQEMDNEYADRDRRNSKSKGPNEL
jgi:hypothetical protein